MAGPDPLKPKPNPNIGLPTVNPGMNRIAPSIKGGGKGSKLDPTKGIKPKKKRKLKTVSSGPAPGKEGPPLSESISEDDDEDDQPHEPGPLSAPKDEKTEEGTEKEQFMGRVRKRMERCIVQSSDNRKMAKEDLEFYVGKQWPDDIVAQRNFDRRPCLTVNKIPVFVHQVINDIRQNRPSINISPVGDKGDPEVAKMYRGLIRSIERMCAADIAYDQAVKNAVINGEGFFRIITDWEEPDSFDQVIKVVLIRNPFTVYMDPDCIDPTCADATYGFVTDMIPRKEFEAKWPDADPMPFTQGGIGEGFKNWATEDHIRIAEYFEIQTEMRTLIALGNGHIGWKDELSDAVKGMIKEGTIEVLRERESEVKKVKWYKLTAVDILEKKDWLGDSVPIVRVTGDEIDIDGKIKLFGLVRNAKDPQRMLNYMKTLETEVVALQPKAPFIGVEGQFEGHEDSWKVANTASTPYLEYNPVSLGGVPAPPPMRQPFPTVPAAIETMVQGAAQDMIAVTGIRFDATMNERMVDESGKAIRELRRTGDIGSFHYWDNLSRALRRAGEIMIDLIPKVYDTKRMVTILREDDGQEQIQIDPNASRPYQEAVQPTTPSQPTPKKLRIFNPTYGHYGVTVTIGPSFATKRIEAAESMMAFVKALPNSAQLVMDIIAGEMDWPGADKIAARLAKAVPPQFMTPDQKDISPQIQAMLQNMDLQIKQMTMERTVMMKAIQEKEGDRQIERDKINKEFETKLLKIVADIETKTAATEEKAVASFNAHIGSRIDELGNSVAELMKQLKPDKEAA